MVATHEASVGIGEESLQISLWCNDSISGSNPLGKGLNPLRLAKYAVVA